MTRKRVKHIVSIKGEDFEVNDNEVITTPYETITIHTAWNYVSIYDAYKNPSDIKRHIWEAWRNWFTEFSDFDFCVCGKNSMQFSIIGKVVDDDGQPWYLYITRNHNRATRIKTN